MLLELLVLKYMNLIHNFLEPCPLTFSRNEELLKLNSWGDIRFWYHAKTNNIELYESIISYKLPFSASLSDYINGLIFSMPWKWILHRVFFLFVTIISSGQRHNQYFRKQILSILWNCLFTLIICKCNQIHYHWDDHY